jgi:hypothetical protein
MTTRCDADKCHCYDGYVLLKVCKCCDLMELSAGARNEIDNHTVAVLTPVKARQLASYLLDASDLAEASA